jgi:hypothetical protein
MLIMTQTKISKAFQTTILEPVEDANALAGSLGCGKKRAHSLKEIKATARKGITKSGRAGLEK